MTTLLNYGVMSNDGMLDVRIIYDHRVMDGLTVARALVRLEEILNSVVLEEVWALAPRALQQLEPASVRRRDLLRVQRTRRSCRRLSPLGKNNGRSATSPE